MTRAILTIFIFIGLLTTACVGVAESRIEEGLLVAARKALPGNISTNEIVQALQTGLWHSNKTAVAMVFKRPKASLVFVFLRQTNGQYLAADVSGVEVVNLGHLGSAGRAGYDRLETIPVQWLYRDDGLFQVLWRTRAWKSGQRYTTSEALVIRADGTPLWR